MRSQHSLSQFPSHSCAERPHKTVRISLPPSPPPEEFDMEAETENASSSAHPSQSRRPQRIFGRVVLPTDAVNDKERLGSGSKWHQRELALLKVKFDAQVHSELDVLDVEHQWSASQLQSISPLSAWPGQVNPRFAEPLTVRYRSRRSRTRTRRDLSRRVNEWRRRGD
jgi:hypothetical protein